MLHVAVKMKEMQWKKNRSWDKTPWVSLQCIAEQNTMLTSNLSHSPLSSSSPLEPITSKTINYTSSGKCWKTQRYIVKWLILQPADQPLSQAAGYYIITSPHHHLPMGDDLESQVKIDNTRAHKCSWRVWFTENVRDSNIILLILSSINICAGQIWEDNWIGDHACGCIDLQKVWPMR